MRILVVGGGPAGMSAALQGTELGAEVVLLEAAEVGGTSLNTGPAPVRTLARAARLARDWSSWAGFGLKGPAPEPDLPALLANSARVARYARERKHMPAHLRQQGIELAEQLGPVSFRDPNTLAAANGRSWNGDRIVLAVGGYAARLPVPGTELALTYDDIRSLTALPETAAIIGGADTGCQIASIFADFGVTVSIFEASPSLIGTADASISAGLAGAFRERGIEVHTSTLVRELERDGSEVRVRYANGASAASASFGAVFAAVGSAGQYRGPGPRQRRRRSRPGSDSGRCLPPHERAAHLRGRGRQRAR